jgi:hypothetical protein
MNRGSNSTHDLIEAVIETLQQDINSLQIVGRALTPAEQRRIELSRQAISNLKMILNLPDEDELPGGGYEPQ